MKIQRIGDEIIINISDLDGVAELEHLLDYLHLRLAEMEDKEQLDQAFDDLARDFNKGWWSANQDKFLNP
ncbi:MAG: hypothetical protein AAB316_21065 [Bacteroidota bacterium]